MPTGLQGARGFGAIGSESDLGFGGGDGLQEDRGGGEDEDATEVEWNDLLLMAVRVGARKEPGNGEDRIGFPFGGSARIRRR